MANEKIITEFDKNFPKEKYEILIDEEDDEKLRQVSKPIDPNLIKSDQFKKFAKILYETMFTQKLPDGWMHAGISSIQIDVPIRIFYAYDGNSDKYVLFINPEVEFLGSVATVKMESCLSTPGKKGDVRRFERIRVKYYDIDGNQVTKKFNGWNSRVIQHENDHLDGILWTDKEE